MLHICVSLVFHLLRGNLKLNMGLNQGFRSSIDNVISAYSSVGYLCHYQIDFFLIVTSKWNLSSNLNVTSNLLKEDMFFLLQRNVPVKDISKQGPSIYSFQSTEQLIERWQIEGLKSFIRLLISNIIEAYPTCLPLAWLQEIDSAVSQLWVPNSEGILLSVVIVSNTIVQTFSVH